MEQRLSVVTIGVSDIERAVGFYGSLGWKPTVHQEGAIAFFQAGGLVVSVWSRESLAEDSVRPDSGGWGGITLAHNVRSAEEVDHVLAEAEAAGATIGRAGSEQFWGGYSGVFHDLDGHAWEIAWNPGFPLAADGTVSIS